MSIKKFSPPTITAHSFFTVSVISLKNFPSNRLSTTRHQPKLNHVISNKTMKWNEQQTMKYTKFYEHYIHKHTFFLTSRAQRLRLFELHVKHICLM